MMLRNFVELVMSVNWQGSLPMSPLVPIPATKEPFSHNIVDCVGPLPKTRAGNQYLFTIMCASTRFLEDNTLRKLRQIRL